MAPRGAASAARRAVVDRARLRDRAHALLHLADVVEDADRHPHHPTGHGDDADAEPDRDRDVAERHRALAPQPYREAPET